MAEIKAWITVKGRHIPIMEGESKEDAIKRLKEGARKGKSTRPISKEAYEKKKKATEKSFKGWEEHKDRVRNADKRLEKDTSDEAKKEKLNADRTLKEAHQRYRKRVTEQEEAMKHPKYTSIKVTRKEKPVEQSNKVTEQEKAFRIENNKKALNQYREWEKQKKQELEDYTNSSEYRRGHYSWDDNEAKQKVESKKKELEDSVEKNRKEALRIVQKLQEDGALPRYSQPREDGEPGPGTILDSTVKADPRYETLSNSLKYKKHQATSMLRNIMYAEEEGKNSFSTTVFDFEGGRRYSYSQRTATYLNKPGEEGYTNFGEFLRDYKKAMKEAGWKVTATENADSHRAGYRTARGGYQSASHSSARTLTFEKIPEKAVKPKTTKSWQDKDAEVKVKQIANADKQKAERNGKNGEPKLEYDLGGNLLGRDGKLAKNMSKQELEDWQKEVERKGAETSTSKWSKHDVSYAKQVMRNIDKGSATLNEMTPTYLKIVAGAGFGIDTEGMSKKDIVKAICDKAGLDYKTQKIGYKQQRRRHLQEYTMGLTLILTDEELCELMCGAPEQDDEETEDE